MSSALAMEVVIVIDELLIGKVITDAIGADSMHDMPFDIPAGLALANFNPLRDYMIPRLVLL